MALRHGGDNRLCAHVLDRINPVIHQGPRDAGLLSGFNEAYIGECAKTHVARAAIQSVSINPGPRTVWSDLQI
jgi:hypothetical protein